MEILEQLVGLLAAEIRIRGQVSHQRVPPRGPQRIVERFRDLEPPLLVVAGLDCWTIAAASSAIRNRVRPTRTEWRAANAHPGAAPRSREPDAGSSASSRVHRRTEPGRGIDGQAGGAEEASATLRSQPVARTSRSIASGLVLARNTSKRSVFERGSVLRRAYRLAAAAAAGTAPPRRCPGPPPWKRVEVEVGRFHPSATRAARSVMPKTGQDERRLSASVALLDRRERRGPFGRIEVSSSAPVAWRPGLVPNCNESAAGAPGSGYSSEPSIPSEGLSSFTPVEQSYRRLAQGGARLTGSASPTRSSSG